MRADELDYDLPEALIAQEPAPEREASRLLVLARARAEFAHARITDLPGLLPPALFVFNDTRVIPARLVGTKPTGGRFELLLVEQTDPAPTNDDVNVPGTRTLPSAHEQRWLCMAKPLKTLRPGMQLSIGALQIEIGERVSEMLLAVTLRAQAPLDVDAALATAGELPLPPYIARKPVAADRERYQTVFARAPGAVAAPTAGLHFGQPLLHALEAAGHQRAFVTLHVGPGTFAPLAAEDLRDHPMHSEHFEIPEQTARMVHEAKQSGRPVVAVGTTVVRTLEASAREHGEVRAGAGATDLCIYPPYQLRVIDALVTNFHLPRSTLLALVMAFAGTEVVRAAYEEAVRERYRFFSYGDAMLIKPEGASLP